MRVQELARDLGVEADTLIALLRQRGIPVTGARSAINDAQQAKVLAKIERERRAGHSDPAKAIQAVLEEARPHPVVVAAAAGHPKSRHRSLRFNGV
ncbi:MAG: hypothetical protein Ct9H300mP15_09000 [Gemmatimonadota bacterium]|nr:MAG: hypothetical protein Ct9H300mP15_09000 [Gemmatimonadota bacterium]